MVGYLRLLKKVAPTCLVEWDICEPIVGTCESSVDNKYYKIRERIEISTMLYYRYCVHVWLFAKTWAVVINNKCIWVFGRLGMCVTQLWVLISGL